MNTFLEMKNIHLQRDDFNLRVEHLVLRTGHLYTLQGANGAGKSTLLQTLALLLKPHSGELFISGEKVSYKPSELKTLRRNVTLLDQNPLLFSGTVSQNLTFGLRFRRVPDTEQQHRIEQALATTGLQGFSQRIAKELSVGEARRVALARALVLQPKLLLLDEPATSLDVEQVDALERLLIRLPEQGMTVVIATHDARQPERLGGENLSLLKGRLELSRPSPVKLEALG